MDGFVGWIGMGAALCTTIAFVPQVAKTVRTRSARDLSLAMLSIFWVGLVLWLWYGILLGALPIILANAVTLALATVLVVLKLLDR